MKKRSKFSLSHYKLATMDMGELVPVSWFEALPGDTIQMQTSAFVRVAPTLAPVMTPCHVEFRTFSVPLRLLWDNGKDDCWESFITGGEDGLDASVPPYSIAKAGSTCSIGSLMDYLGFPSGEQLQADVEYSMFPLRAYSLIWSEYFRDQDLQEDPARGVTGGLIAEVTGSFGSPLKKVSWRKDYFTVARPFEQKGPAVTIPVSLTTGEGGSLITANTTISGNGVPSFTNGTATRGLYGTIRYEPAAEGNPASTTSEVKFGNGGDTASSSGFLSWANPNLRANTTIQWNGSNNASGAISVDDIREAFALQRFEEARALFGSRYVEYLRYLGVRSSDARLQRPEYLGGGSQVVQWSEVVQTAQGSDPVGTLRGHGVSAGRTRRWRRFFEEHCIVMTVAWIRPVALYTQGLNRAWSRTLKEDYWQKELEHIGQQEVLNKELYAFGNAPDGVFGFMDRYDEYRSVQNTVCGNFRDTMDYWHLGRVFANQPTLNSDFITCNPSKRVFAEQTADEFYCMFLHSVQARRLISRRGRPGGL